LARPLVVGNGGLLVCFDERLVLRDLFYPHVGQVNHVVGRRNQIGVWADGDFTWLGDDGWERRLGYAEGSLVTESVAVHAELGLELTVRDGVHQREDILLRHLHIRNLKSGGDRRDIRLFSAIDFDLDETDVGDTALYDPALDVVFHYKRNRWFLAGARGPEGGIWQYATGRKRFMGAEGTWRDAEDGTLEGHPISQGSVDAAIGLLTPLGPGAAADTYLWIVCATDYKGAAEGHRLVTATGPERLLAEIDGYWRSWSGEGPPDLSALPPDLQEACRRSLLIIRTQVDNCGAILAANDTDILQFNRDHYSYMWPRDGALVAAALDRAGYRAIVRSFLGFCQGALSDEGFLWHKYNPDGTVGSSWHPWLGTKGAQLPIQEDETALVLWTLGQHFRTGRDHEFTGSLYDGLIRPAADFLVRYRDGRTGLPRESYDLWEERRGIFTFTVAAVVAGLTAAAEMASALGDAERGRQYAEAAASTKEAMLRHLWSEKLQRFLRGLYVCKDGRLVPDEVLESSVMGVFLLGVLEAGDPKMESTARQIAEGLRPKTNVGGVARYYDDYYFRRGDDPEVSPGNPWIICTLWIARWQIARARTLAELKPATEAVRWALAHALPTGALPEQLDPFTGAPLSVTPLTWSHATMVDTLLDLAARLQHLPA
jgi:GH15 family glucan-1,4-alpha-glucosidase